MSRENSDLSARVKELSQERINQKHTLSCLEGQLRQAETENRPSTDLSNSKVSHTRQLTNSHTHTTSGLKVPMDRLV